jgi:ferredoxin
MNKLICHRFTGNSLASWAFEHCLITRTGKYHIHIKNKVIEPKTGVVMNRFIMANSQQCIGCRACEVACVMAHNDEQHVLSERHFHPRITVLVRRQKARYLPSLRKCPLRAELPERRYQQSDDSVQVNQQKCIAASLRGGLPVWHDGDIVTPLTTAA